MFFQRVMSGKALELLRNGRLDSKTRSAIAGYWTFNEGSGTEVHDLGLQRLDTELPSAPVPYSSVVLESSPILYFPLDDKSVSIRDLSGFRRDGKPGGVTFSNQPATPQTGHSVGFTNGTAPDSFIATRAIAKHVKQLSLEAWVRPNSLATFDTIYSAVQSTPGAVQWQFRNNGLQFSITGGPDRIFGTATDFPLNEWTHIVVTFDAVSGNATTYANGRSLGTQNLGQVTPTLGEAFLGAAFDNGSFIRHFDGRIDEFAIYDRALSPHEIGRHFAAANQVDQRPEWTTDVPVELLPTIGMADGGQFTLIVSADDGDARVTQERTFSVDNLAPTPSLEVKSSNQGARAALKSVGPSLLRAISSPFTVGSIGQEIEFDAAGSTDPGDDLLDFVWEVAASNGQTVLPGSEKTFRFTPEFSGVYDVTLTAFDVDEEIGSTTRSALTTHSVLVNPVARITQLSSSGQNVGELFRFDAGGSSSLAPSSLLRGDPDSMQREFVWLITPTSGQPLPALITSTTSPEFEFIPLAAGAYDVRLTIIDHILVGGVIDDPTPLLSGGDLVTITVGTVTQPAIVTSELAAIEGNVLAFDVASLPSAPPAETGATREFRWEASHGTTSIVGTNSSFSFAPNDDGDWTVQLVVTDRIGTKTLLHIATPISVAVGNSPPDYPWQTELIGEEAVPFNLSLPITDRGADTFTFTVNWGDPLAIPASNQQSGNVTGNALQLTHTYADDGEYDITLTVNDEDGGTRTQSARITILNRGPVATDNTVSITEDQTADFDDAFLLQGDSDPAGGNDPLSVVEVDSVSTLGAAILSLGNGQYRYDPSQSAVIQALNGTVAQIDELHYTISDGDGSVRRATVQIILTPANDLPIAIGESRVIDEDASLEIDVLANDRDIDGTLAAGSVAMVGGPAHGSVTINSTTGVVTYTPDDDYTGPDEFRYTVRDNSNGTSNIATVEINVVAINDAPGASIDTPTVVENLAGSVIGRLSAIDPDSGDVHNFSVADERFEIVLENGQPQLKLRPGVQFDHETSATIAVPITVSDSGSPELAQTTTLTITVTNVNEAPTAIRLIGGTVNENAAGAVIGQLVADDPDRGSVHTFTVADPRFEIVSGQLKLKSGESFDFETQAAILVDIVATDQGTPPLSVTQSVSVGINDVLEGTVDNRPPTEIRINGAPVVENEPGAVIGNITVVDPDAGDSHTITVSDSRFEVAAGQLRLKAGQSLNFEAAQQVSVVLTATDAGGLSFSRNLLIDVTDVNEPALRVFIVNENAEGETLGTLAVDDPDFATSQTFTVSDDRFEFNGRVLKLKSGESLDFETASSITVQITATDSADPNLKITESFTIDVVNLNDPPASISLDNLTVREKLTGAAIGRITVVDQDAADTHTLTVDDQRFEIVAGVLRLRTDSALSIDGGTTVVVQITARDNANPAGERTQATTIDIASNRFPWQNSAIRFDANRDGFSTPQDALVIINELNVPRVIGQFGKLPETRPADSDRHFYDVNGDGFGTPQDVLNIINELNRRAAGEGEFLSASTGADRFAGLASDAALSHAWARPVPSSSDDLAIPAEAEPVDWANSLDAVYLSFGNGSPSGDAPARRIDPLTEHAALDCLLDDEDSDSIWGEF